VKKVAVSQRIDEIPDRDEIRDALDQRLVMFLLTAGYLPIPVPNSLNSQASGDERGLLKKWLAQVNPEAIVLSGGNDLGTYPERDQTENLLLNYAWDHQLPLLGICRGMQMMAHWTGTELHKVSGHVRNRHRLSGAIEREVNSYHEYALKNCPEEFEVLANSEDGEIEAIQHCVRSWEGWMWHPERESKFSRVDIDRLHQVFQ